MLINIYTCNLFFHTNSYFWNWICEETVFTLGGKSYSFYFITDNCDQSSWVHKRVTTQCGATCGKVRVWVLTSVILHCIHQDVFYFQNYDHYIFADFIWQIGFFLYRWFRHIFHQHLGLFVVKHFDKWSLLIYTNLYLIFKCDVESYVPQCIAQKNLNKKRSCTQPHQYLNWKSWNDVCQQMYTVYWVFLRKIQKWFSYWKKIEYTY